MNDWILLYIWGVAGCILGGFLIGSESRVAGAIVWLIGFGLVLLSVKNGAFG